MHCAFQEKGNDSPKVSEAGKDSISTSLEVTKVNYSPIFSLNCSIESG